MSPEEQCTSISPDIKANKIKMSIFVLLAAGSVGALIAKAVWAIDIVGPWLAIPAGLVLPVATLYTVWTNHTAHCPRCGEPFSLHPHQTCMMCIECKTPLLINNQEMKVCIDTDKL